jgi:hypothetical protein
MKNFDGRLTSTPDGMSVTAPTPPILDGGLGAYAYNSAQLTGTASGISGRLAEGQGFITLTPTANLSPLVFVSGDGSLTFTVTGLAASTLSLSGEATATFDFDNNVLTVINPTTGEFTMQFSGDGDVRGLNSLSGEFRNSDTEVIVDYGGAVYIAPWGTDGYSYPAGTASRPVLTLDCALAICKKYDLKIIYLRGSYILDDDDTGLIDNFEFKGWGPIQFCKLDLGGLLLDSVHFHDLVIEGELNTTTIGGTGWQSSIARVQFDSCYLQSVTNLQGVARHCQIEGPTSIAPGGWFSSADTVIEGDYTVFDMQSTAGTTISMDVTSGWSQFDNAVDGCLIELNVKGGEVSFKSSCTGGEYYLEGVGTLFNDSAMTQKENHLVEGNALDELHKLKGLNAENPVVATGDGQTSKTLTTAGVTLTITQNGITRT